MTPFEARAVALTRREFLRSSGLGIGALALGGLLGESLYGAAPADAPGGPLAPRTPHFAPRAKRVIYLHMVGAPSQLELFDYKPELRKHDGQPCPKEFIEGKRFAFIRGHPHLMATRYNFARHGQSGQEISELLPHLATVADEIAIVKSVHTDEFNHGPAQIFLHTGFGRLGRPAFGSWVSYGLGTENQDLPAYVVMVSGPDPGGGSSLWSAGFLPSVHQATRFRSDGDPVLFLSNPPGHTREARRHVLDAINDLNRGSLAEIGDPEIATRISQYEMAFRMQTGVPDLADLAQESAATLELYGAKPGGVSFANNCLLARRLVERGVRVVELYDADWDHHGNIWNRLPVKCRETDQPIAALIRDLKQRGLLDDTLVVWGGEFGRTPMLQTEGAGRTAPGRDHHKEAFTMWLAGGGIKGGLTFGRTDELGYNIVEHPVHVHDLNATILHQLGLDHERLTFRYQGRNFRLTDVHGHVVKPLLA